MRASTIYKLFNLALAWLGITLIVSGLQKMNVSNYTSPEMPSGWMMGMAWIVFGIVIALTWITFLVSQMVVQKINGTSRFTRTKLVAISFVLFFSVISASVGTYLTWKHPLLLGPCDCDSDHWGPNCKPCQCVYGVCDSGQFGSGRCSCDFGFAGDNCNQCDDRHKPEPTSEMVVSGDSLACDQCKTGYFGPELVENRPKCDECDIGYTGEECDICDKGWQPWYKNSSLFPKTITDDDNRHICDECLPNHWGYFCLECPWGNDVPRVTLNKNNRIKNGTRVRDSSRTAGVVVDMQIYTFPSERDIYTPLEPTKSRERQWVPSYNYEADDLNVLDHTRVRIDYDDSSQGVSDWVLFKDLEGVQCNNRGYCMDDARRLAEIELQPDWKKKCSYEPSFQECSSDRDCTVSENCMGRCQAVVTSNGVDGFSNWAAEGGVADSLCKTDEDCYQPTFIIQDDKKVYTQNYTGGRCTRRGCCKESWHGDGNCVCEQQFFGPLLNKGTTEQYQASPACDFCPGYDWFTENPFTICSGSKGTCSASYDRSGNYVQMRCSCGSNPYISPEGIVDPNKIIEWLGDVCQCGDWDEDGRCDTCASGHWGPNCLECPGGAFSQCGGKGRGSCNSGIDGDGTCTCTVNGPSHWMLAPYVKRYATEVPPTDNFSSSDVCTECAPNYYGNNCLRCQDTYLINSGELKGVFQPAGSYLFGGDIDWKRQSSAEPWPVCHRGYCSVACNGGGWCNWGRGGDGRCTCWSNVWQNNYTWNPLDNVCIGTDRFGGSEIYNESTLDIFIEGGGKGGEYCRGFGRCVSDNEGENSNRNTAEICGPTDWIGDTNGKKLLNISQELSWDYTQDWSGQTKRCNSETCAQFNKIDWRPSNTFMQGTCHKRY